MPIHSLRGAVAPCLLVGAMAMFPGCGGDDAAEPATGAPGSGGAAGAQGGSSGSSGAGGDGAGGGAGAAGGAAGAGAGGSAGAGAGGSAGAGASGAAGAGGVEIGKVQVDWKPCKLLQAYPPTGATKKSDGECADVTVPLKHDEPGGPTITVRVKRLLATAGPAHGQLWLLNGGPGSSSLELEPVMLDLAVRDPGLDVYTTDFRGTGESSRLTCLNDTTLKPASVEACLGMVAPVPGDLGGFTTTEGARDVASLIAATREPGKQAIAFGFSYGTFWLHRLLQIYPALLDGAVLDSIATPSADFSVYSVDADAVAQEFFGLCGADPTCSSKLGAEPWAKVQQLFALPPAELCPVGIDGPGLKQAFSRLLRKTDLRPLVPALVYRLLRCSPDDKKAFSHLLQALQALPPEPAEAFSTLLYLNVALSELWPASPKTPAEYDAIDASLLIAPGNTGYFQQLWDVWPRPPLDQYAGHVAGTSTPLLLLQGGLDPQTNIKYVNPFAASFSAEAQHYVTFPLSPHGVAFQTPKASDPTTSCGMDLVLQFAANPQAPLDLACMSDLQPLDFGDQPEAAQALLGQPSIWEPAAPPPSPLPPPSLSSGKRASLEQQLREAFARP
jgi:pimeloyl-ACP methyl ester carboxylesterase